MARDISLADLEANLGYVFAKRALLEQALMHVSAVRTNDPRSASNQRLEFLGDRVLGLAVSAMLHETFPKAEEGELSRRLADLVRRESCAAVAQDWQLGTYVKLGGGEAQSGGRKKNAILADACEAVIGAVFLDAGFPAAAALVERSWRERMLAPQRPLRDAKTRLQEWAQGRGLPPPAYREISRVGPDHSPLFTVGVDVDSFALAEGQGASKRVAEQSAAIAFLTREGIELD